MLVLVLSFSLLIVGLCAYGLITPRGYVAIARWIQAVPGLWGAFALRLALAIALWLSASSSATPEAFRVLAVLTGLGALALPVIGPDRFRMLIEWGAAQPFWLLRSLCVLGLFLGFFLLWSSWTGLRAA